jgi:hypothetical protein
MPNVGIKDLQRVGLTHVKQTDTSADSGCILRLNKV